MRLFNRSKDLYPVIGKAINWNYCIGRVFRVIDFLRSGTIIKPNGQVKAKSAFRPYGYLVVEDPNYQTPILLPIVHRDDFLLASSVYDYPELKEMLTINDLLVTYLPKGDYPKGFAGIHHALHFVITNSSSFPLFYKIEDESQYDLRREKLFGTFKWEGELSVQLHLNPEW